MGISLFFSTFYALISLILQSSASTDTLQPNQNLTDGLTLISSNQRFELGFFTPGNGSSGNRYLGIWYHGLPLTVVWVANRNNPIPDSSSKLTLDESGLLILYNRSLSVVWSSNNTAVARNITPILQLLDSGNLVIKDGGEDRNFIWESFNFPSDTLLPGMKLGWKLDVGLNRYIRSWKSDEDPSDGGFSFSLDSPETPQLFIKTGSQKLYRWGPFDGNRFSGSNVLRANALWLPMFVYNSDEVYYEYEMLDDPVLVRKVVSPLGNVEYRTWRINSSTEWNMVVRLNTDPCDSYAKCGPYGSCYSQNDCRCLGGFTPISPQDWSLFNFLRGCRRRYELNCSDADGFVKYDGLKLPDNAIVWEEYGEGECGVQCLKNCSCMAYTEIGIHGNGTQCVVWVDELVDMRNFPNGGEQIFVRMARAELQSIADAERKHKVVKIVIILTVLGGVLLSSGIILYVFWIIRGKRKGKTALGPEVAAEDGGSKPREERPDENLQLPLFDFDSIFLACDNFSDRNKIGQGGFGIVYKGTLPNGQEIAVKRLSEKSIQGIEELKNEIMLIAKLQHRNLVKLLGCCIEKEESMLVYEYLPNRSLNNFIYDKATRKLLPWRKRFNIILGVARGLLYLHHDSRLRIIHRDLKTSNILLDSELNPKISDFGIARIFGGDHTQEMTKRVIGTYGYMSPEYAMSGHYSVKSDVFSFGVIVLEIISSQKNWAFRHPDHDFNLLGHAWKLWKEGVPLEILDPMLDNISGVNEVIRCIQVALLCVQQYPEDRPTMSTVISMLSYENMEVADPKEPGFCKETPRMNDSSASDSRSTANEITMTTLGGR